MRNNIIPDHMSKEDVESFGEEMLQLKHEISLDQEGFSHSHLGKMLPTRIFLLSATAFLFGIFSSNLVAVVASFIFYFLWYTQTAYFAHLSLHGSWGNKDYAHPLSVVSDGKYPFPFVETTSWKSGHNATHHVYTNIYNVDPDVDYGVFRLSKAVPWKPIYLGNILWGIAGVFFSLEVQHHHASVFAKKKNKAYLPLFLKGFLGTLLRWSPHIVILPTLVYLLGSNPWIPVFCFWGSQMLANLLITFVLLSGHTYNCVVFDENVKQSENFAEWSLLQIQGTNNLHFNNPILDMLLCEFTHGLSTQTEHHLFPVSSSTQQFEAKKRVKEICKKYGIKYNSTHYLRSLIEVPVRLIRYSLP